MCQITNDQQGSQAKPNRDPDHLPENWHGFRFDERGDLITRSGYKASPQLIESALWLLGCWTHESRRYLIRSDEARGALRPLYETSDVDPQGKIKPTRLQLVEPEQERVSQDANGAAPRPGELAPAPSAAGAHASRSKAQTSAAKEPPLQRLRRATASDIEVAAPSGHAAPLAGEHAARRPLGGYPLL